MMIVDERIGSRDLLGPLQRFGVPADLGRLDYGDFAFVGKGLHGADVIVGVELKESRDIVKSMQSGRFAGHQLLGLASGEYKMYDRAWLVTEGIWRADDGGVLQHFARGWHKVSVGARPVMLNDLETWILTQVIRGGMTHWHCSTREDTIRFLSVLYHWWTDKELQEHRSHQQIYLPPPDRVMMTEPSTFLKMVSCIEGVGWEKGKALEAHFTNPVTKHGDWELMRIAALSNGLTAVPGIGKKLAGNIRTALGIV
jgi:hypothetical protein